MSNLFFSRVSRRDGCAARNKRPSHQAALAARKGVGAVYLLGPALEELALIALLERDFGVLVVQGCGSRANPSGLGTFSTGGVTLKNGFRKYVNTD
jgi:hypothetical protein